MANGGQRELRRARVLAMFGDSLTTDHISPAGGITVDSPAGRYLLEHGIEPMDFNQYGARRGNHEVMMRGTFANVGLKNLMLPGVEGNATIHYPDGDRVTIFDAAMRYKDEGVPLVIVAGKEYGTGSSRDWAAKGPALLGVRAVLAESFERIHRSNLVSMGVLPLQFKPGQNAQTLALSGSDVITVAGLASPIVPAQDALITVEKANGDTAVFTMTVRLDTPVEVEYYANGGVLPTVLRRLMANPRQDD
jgi:aconitate hydratase